MKNLLEHFLMSFFHDEGPNGIETNPLICRANPWTGFCTIGPSVMRELIKVASCRSPKKHCVKYRNFTNFPDVEIL